MLLRRFYYFPLSLSRCRWCTEQVAEIAVLLGLMCKYSCEECQLIVYGLNYMQSVDLMPGTILYNMDRVLDLCSVNKSRIVID